MQLSNLPKLTVISKKRLGRGIGSGRGKTSGRGTKGQKARGKIPAANVGAGLVYYKKLPLNRGQGRRGTKSTRSPKAVIITFAQLNNLKPNTKVDLACLIDKKIVSAREAKSNGVKILSKGELKVALQIALPVSETAKKMIEQAGGSIVG